MTEGSASLYHVYQEPREGGPPHPGLLLLHGRGANEYDLLGLEIDSRLFTVSARAPVEMWGGYHWYMPGEMGRDQAGFERALGLVQAFAAELPSLYPIDRAKLIVVGFSQGAVLACALTLSRPDLMAATAVLSGCLPAHRGFSVEEKAIAGHHIFIGHGTEDPGMRIEMGREARDYLASAGASVDYHEYPMGHQVSLDELHDLRRWLGGPEILGSEA